MAVVLDEADLGLLDEALGSLYDELGVTAGFAYAAATAAAAGPRAVSPATPGPVAVSPATGPGRPLPWPVTGDTGEPRV